MFEVQDSRFKILGCLPEDFFIYLLIDSIMFEKMKERRARRFRKYVVLLLLKKRNPMLERRTAPELAEDIIDYIETSRTIHHR